MDSIVKRSVLDFRAGDQVILVSDDWSSVGREIIVVDAEPVPGSTQCVIRADGETRIVSRGELRRAA